MVDLLVTRRLVLGAVRGHGVAAARARGGRGLVVAHDGEAQRGPRVACARARALGLRTLVLARQPVNERPEERWQAGHAGAYHPQLDLDQAVFAHGDQIICWAIDVKILNTTGNGFGFLFLFLLSLCFYLPFQGALGSVATYGSDSWYELHRMPWEA